MDYTIDNITDFFKEATNKSIPAQMIIYSSYKRYQDLQQELTSIANLFDDKYYHLVTPTKIDEEMYVVKMKMNTAGVKWNDPKSDWYYTPVFCGKRANTVYTSFDRALVALLSLKYCGKEEDGIYASRLLNIN